MVAGALESPAEQDTFIFENKARELHRDFEIVEIVAIRFFVSIGDDIGEIEFEAQPAKGRVFAFETNAMIERVLLYALLRQLIVEPKLCIG